MKIRNSSVYLIIFMFSIIGYGQDSEYLDGEIVTRSGDTLFVKIKVLNRFQSFRRINYMTASGSKKKMLAEDVRMYKRGKEEFETLILAYGVYVLAKKLIQGPNVNLYVVESKESFNQRLLNEALGKNMPTVRQHKYLKLATGHVINATLSGKSKVKRFLNGFPLVVEMMENEEIKSVEEIVVECNNIR